MTARRPRYREWWQTVSSQEFREQIAAMPTPELQALAGVIAGELTEIQAAFEHARANGTDYVSVRGALARIAQRKAVLRGELQSRNDKNTSQKQRAKRELIGRARDLLTAGDIAGSLFLVLDWLEGRYPGIAEGTVR